MIRTELTRRLGVEAPLVGFNRSPEVVIEVSRAGGLGVLAVTPYTPEQLDAQLTWIEERLDGRPYGVDLLLPAKRVEGDADDYLRSLRAQIPEEHLRFVDGLMDKYGISKAGTTSADNWATSLSPSGVDELLEVAFAHDISLIASALGTPPSWMVTRAKETGVAVAALVGAGKHAQRQLDLGVDILVAQGTEAGGHTGTVSTMVLTPEIVDLGAQAGVPVLAAGGIASGRQMAAALTLGAAGVWCGSVWLSSNEDITPDVVKRKFLAARSTDTLRSPTRTGKPARQLRTVWHDEWEREDAPKPLPMPLQSLLVRDLWEEIDREAEAGEPGAKELASFYIGQAVGSFQRLRPTREITERMIAECEAELRRAGGLLG
ncbi:nitronate monooxygenase [Streptomyces mutabilis]|uniref:NAD(P)H-dependent flavin oxidoreductase n=1 Tax=Streptomyces mutabilis TaxID=67332 RepID=UPI0033AE9CCD